VCMQAMHGLPRVSMHAREREGTRGPSRVVCGRLGLSRSLFEIVLNCSIFGICKNCPNLNGFKRWQDLEKLYLVEL
jgi:hypothetical protein